MSGVGTLPREIALLMQLSVPHDECNYLPPTLRAEVPALYLR